MHEYAFRNMILGDVDNVVNTMAEKGFTPDTMYKEGARMYILFNKWVDEGDEIELSELEHCYEEMGQVSSRLHVVEQAIALLGAAPVLEEESAEVE